MGYHGIYPPIARELTSTKKKHMNEETHVEVDDELRPEYDLPQLQKDGVRGKYAERYQAGSRLALLAPDKSG